MFRTMFKYRELLSELTKREVKQRYKQSILGYAWVILNPFFQMLVMAFVFKFLLRVQDLGVPYAIFLYAGLLPWTLFANSLGSSVNALVGNAGLLTKIYFPREIFILSTILAKMIDFFLASTVFVAMMIWYKIPITWNVLWFVPIFLIQMLFTYGLSLLVAAFNLFYRDIQYILGLLIMVWMYLTPVIYPTEMFPDRYRFIFQLNPMAVFVNAYRQVILGGGAPNFISLGIGLLVSVVLTIIGYLVFKKLEGQFADVV
ncbi:MAG TPA: ABC transporter permease [Candidatus Woesebacteria bacterium]|nr:ABC transporter permease [Candidatus Woesebacteria bacterium]